MAVSVYVFCSLKFLKEHNIPYIGFEKEYLWFNNAQLNRLLNGNYFFDSDSEEYKNSVCLSFKIHDENHRKSPLDKMVFLF